MTALEAIIILSGFNLRNNADKHDVEALNMAQDALEKQIPLPLDYVGDGYADDGNILYDTAICCSCGRRFERYCEEHYKYCPGCGQALNWSDEDES